MEIVCDVFSNPPVSSISISRGGQDIISSPTVTVKDLETEVGDAFYHQRRIIRLEEVAESDYGTYDCNAVSSLDSITGTVSLLRTSKYHNHEFLPFYLKPLRIPLCILIECATYHVYGAYTEFGMLLREDNSELNRFLSWSHQGGLDKLPVL